MTLFCPCFCEKGIERQLGIYEDTPTCVCKEITGLHVAVVDTSKHNCFIFLSRSDKVVIDVKKRGGYNKLCSLSPQLQKIVGAAELTGPQVCSSTYRDNCIPFCSGLCCLE